MKRGNLNLLKFDQLVKFANNQRFLQLLAMGTQGGHSLDNAEAARSDLSREFGQGEFEFLDFSALLAPKERYG